MMGCANGPLGVSAVRESRTAGLIGQRTARRRFPRGQLGASLKAEEQPRRPAPYEPFFQTAPTLSGTRRLPPARRSAVCVMIWAAWLT